MVLSSDNGGYVKNDNGGCNTTSGMDGLPSTDSGHGGACFNGEAGANNFPLRAGSKRPTVSLETTRTRRLLNSQAFALCPQSMRCSRGASASTHSSAEVSSPQPSVAPSWTA